MLISALQSTCLSLSNLRNLIIFQNFNKNGSNWPVISKVIREELIWGRVRRRDNCLSPISLAYPANNITGFVILQSMSVWRGNLIAAGLSECMKFCLAVHPVSGLGLEEQLLEAALGHAQSEAVLQCTRGYNSLMQFLASVLHLWFPGLWDLSLGLANGLGSLVRVLDHFSFLR